MTATVNVYYRPQNATMDLNEVITVKQVGHTNMFSYETIFTIIKHSIQSSVLRIEILTLLEILLTLIS